MSRNGVIFANSLILLSFLAWGGWLLSQVRSTTDYLADRVLASGATCSWIRPSDRAVASLGLSHEQQHSWTDRVRAYIVMKVPALPSGGRIDIEIINLKADSLDIRLLEDAQHYRIRRTGVFSIKLPVSVKGKVEALVLDSNAMSPPQGADRRWLGVAISRLRICSN